MAIVEMSKIRLLGLTSDREEILNSLQKTGSVEVVDTAEIEDTVVFSCEQEKSDVSAQYSRINKCIEFFANTLKSCEKEEYYPKNANEYLKNFFVGYDEFISIINKEDSINKTIEVLEDYMAKVSDARSEIIKLNNLRSQLSVYLGSNANFSEYKDTKTSTVVLGTIKSENLINLSKFLEDFNFTELSILKNSETSVISIVSF